MAGMTRSAGHAASLRALGAAPIVGDVFEADALRAALVAFGPDVVVQQLTDFPDDRARIAEFAAATSRIRREGSRNLLAAARAAGASGIRGPERGLAAAGRRWSGGGRDGAGGARGRRGRGPLRAVLRTRHHVAEAARRTVPLLSAPSGVVLVVEEE